MEDSFIHRVFTEILSSRCSILCNRYSLIYRHIFNTTKVLYIQHISSLILISASEPQHSTIIQPWLVVIIFISFLLQLIEIKNLVNYHNTIHFRIRCDALDAPIYALVGIWYIVGTILYFINDIEYNIVNILGIIYLAQFYINIIVIACIMTGLCYSDRYRVDYSEVEEQSIEMNNLEIRIKGEMYEMNGNKEECLICAENFDEKNMVIRLNCSSLHMFHEKCLKDWIKIKPICPICRTKIRI